MFARFKLSSGLVVFLSLIVVAGSLIALAYSTSQTEIETTNVYRGFRYSVVTPDGWQGEEVDTIRKDVKFKPAGSNFPVTQVVVTDAYEKDLNVNVYTNRFLDRAEAEITNFKLLNINTSEVLDLDATEIEYTHDGQDSAKLKSKQVDVVVNDNLYRITFTAPEADYNMYLPTFVEMLVSVDIY